jgi:hypothetical protein
VSGVWCVVCERVLVCGARVWCVVCERDLVCVVRVCCVCFVSECEWCVVYVCAREGSVCVRARGQGTESEGVIKQKSTEQRRRRSRTTRPWGNGDMNQKQNTEKHRTAPAPITDDTDLEDRRREYQQLHVEYLKLYQQCEDWHSYFKVQRASERASERSRERESARARERESARAREREHERASERESKRRAQGDERESEREKDTHT